MAFTSAESSDIRRFCGYPMFGDTPEQAFGYRFFQHYGTLEFRMMHASVEEEAIVRAMLTRLTKLEGDLYGVGDNLDTDKAAVWERNKSEFKDRMRLYNFHRCELCKFFGVPPGSDFGGSGSLRVVV